MKRLIPKRFYLFFKLVVSGIPVLSLLFVPLVAQSQETASSGYRMIQTTRTAETEWMAEADKRVRDTLFYNCNSWYLGANIPSKPRKFIPYLGFSDYLARCNDISSRGYPGLLFE